MTSPVFLILACLLGVTLFAVLSVLLMGFVRRIAEKRQNDNTETEETIPSQDADSSSQHEQDETADS